MVKASVEKCHPLEDRGTMLAEVIRLKEKNGRQNMA